MRFVREHHGQDCQDERSPGNRPRQVAQPAPLEREQVFQVLPLVGPAFVWTCRLHVSAFVGASIGAFP